MELSICSGMTVNMGVSTSHVWGTKNMWSTFSLRVSSPSAAIKLKQPVPGFLILIL